jgi:hypothetical protein
MPRRPKTMRGVAARGQVLAGVQRLLEGDAHAALEQHREVVLRAHRLEQLEVLRVARADLQHHAGGVAGLRSARRISST